MLFRKMKNSILAFVFCAVIPASVFAGSDPVWSKLSTVAASGWLEVDTITSQEKNRLTGLANAGDANAQYALGMIHQVKHEHDKAAEWLKLAGEQGHAPARYSYNKNAEGHPDVASLSW